jgi:hypothetical protein
MASLRDLVIGVKVVRLNNRIALLYVTGQGYFYWGWLGACFTLTLQGKTNGVGMRDSALQCFLNGSLQLSNTITIQQV